MSNDLPVALVAAVVPAVCVGYAGVCRLGMRASARPEAVPLLDAGESRDLARSLDCLAQGAALFLRAYLCHALGLGACLAALLGGAAALHGGLLSAALTASAFAVGVGVALAAVSFGVNVTIAAAGRVARLADPSGPAGVALAVTGAAAGGFGPAAAAVLGLLACAGLAPLAHLSAAVTAVPFGAGVAVVALLGRLGGGTFLQAALGAGEQGGKGWEGRRDPDQRNPALLTTAVGTAVLGTTGLALELVAVCLAAVAAAVLTPAAALPPCYPFLVVATGMGVSLVAAVVGGPAEDAESTARQQIRVAVLLNTAAQLGVALWALPPTVSVTFLTGHPVPVRPWHGFAAVAAGLWGAHLSGNAAEYFTTQAYSPVKEVAEACDGGAAPAVLAGLGLGYRANLLPTLLLASTIYVSYNVAGPFGLALAALGAASPVCTLVTAGGLDSIPATAARQIDAVFGAQPEPAEARGQAAAVSRGYAQAAALLAGAALYVAFLVRCAGPKATVAVNLVDPRVFFGLLLGAALPYWLAAMTLQSIGKATAVAVKEVQRQLRVLEFGVAKLPQFTSCVEVTAAAALRRATGPSLLVALIPIFVGLGLGKEALAGLLPGCIAAGLPLGMSVGAAGVAWNSARQYVEAGGLGAKRATGSKEHAAVLVGGAVGDPLRAVVGPATTVATVLILLLSVMLCPAIAQSGWLFDQAAVAWAHRDA